MGREQLPHASIHGSFRRPSGACGAKRGLICRKWLKDRKGRPLSYDDLRRYKRVVSALSETIRLMAEIDALIPSWPIE